MNLPDVTDKTTLHETLDYMISLTKATSLIQICGSLVKHDQDILNKLTYKGIKVEIPVDIPIGRIHITP